MAFIKKPFYFITQKGFHYLRENAKIIGQFILTIFFVGLGIWFIKHEQAELVQIRTLLATSVGEWVVAGVILTVVCIGIQGMMYVALFAAIGRKLTIAGIYQVHLPGGHHYGDNYQALTDQIFHAVNLWHGRIAQ
ncbi:hypothetical protein [Persicitalea jodogahamensis]|uniref:Uncharacterized protein n=1 Tax=Persicitalea jodogahamensis TaxID=402147 RepID=A0A8J3D5Z5_9BACT|nr:hypothetical protein [Persicitalea jodogahamensis]GHB79606.1 hypothetical protein GCM10007390_37100 [Persicitalea jodogahamensis]